MKPKMRVGCLSIACAVLAVAGCKKASTDDAPVPSAAPSATVAPLKLEDIPESQRAPTAWPIPSGPRFAILAGQGLGPIRLGATIATIERLMEAPCDEKTEDTCRYFARAAEFFLKDGVTVEIRTHRQGRPTTPKPRTFGVFNGRTPEGVAFTMLPAGVTELLGKPLRVEPVADGGEAHTVETWVYDGMRIEFDKLPTGSVAVGGITIVKSDKPHKPAPAPKRPVAPKEL